LGRSHHHYGSAKRTEKGELSVNVQEWTMLTKALLPLPDKFKGFTDKEKRYRQRHLDLIVNPEVGTRGGVHVAVECFSL